jgi:predicted alpha/beta hydrolase family esterase
MSVPDLPLVLIVPGLGGSGPDHWQTRWETLYPRHVRVVQRDWDRPDRQRWLAALGAALDGAGEPAFLVAHSLGCALVVHAATQPFAARVRAAFLVAPADVDSRSCTPPETRVFAPLPRARLPFPATVVASETDPYMTLDRARGFAADWGAELVDAGPRGHLNADSGLGDWPAGRAIFESLARRSRL